MRRAFVAGNWKLHGSRQMAGVLLAELADRLRVGKAEVAVCVPFPILDFVRQTLINTSLDGQFGAQDVSAHAEGAYTGEVSAQMLAETGARYVIVGHSERRSYHGESDELVADKFRAAVGAGLMPIFCLGETQAEREAGETESVVARQLAALLDSMAAEDIAKGVLAYEPVWAIGTGLTATPEQAQAVHAFLRGQIAGRSEVLAADMRILYGGSVKAANASDLFTQADIDGGLIGGASLIAEEFSAICQAAEATQG